MAQKQKIKEKYAQLMEQKRQERAIMDQLNGTNFNTTGNDRINRQERKGNMSLREMQNRARQQYAEERRKRQESGARWDTPEPSKRGKMIIEGLKEMKRKKGK